MSLAFCRKGQRNFNCVNVINCWDRILGDIILMLRRGMRDNIKIVLGLWKKVVIFKMPDPSFPKIYRPNSLHLFKLIPLAICKI